MKWILPILMIVFTGCATTPPVITPQPVEIPVAVSCLSKDILSQITPPPTFLSDQEILAGSSYQVPLSLWLDRIQRQDYIAKLEAALGACK